MTGREGVDLCWGPNCMAALQGREPGGRDTYRWLGACMPTPSLPFTLIPSKGQDGAHTANPQRGPETAGNQHFIELSSPLRNLLQQIFFAMGITTPGV